MTRAPQLPGPVAAGPAAVLARLDAPGLGDLLQRNLFLGVLRRALGDAPLTLVLGRTVAERHGAALRRHLLADDVLACPDPGDGDPAAWRVFERELAARRCALCAVDPDSRGLGAEVAARCGIALRVGLPGDGVNRPLRLPPPLFGRPDLFDFATALARALGIGERLRAFELLPRLRLEPAPDALAGLPRPVVALHPGGAPHWNRRWPLARYGELAARLASERRAALVLLGGPGEAGELALLERALRAAAPDAHVRRVLPPTLNDLGNLLAGVDVLVGNDSAPAHVAAAVGTPSVVLYGPTGTAYVWARVYPRHRGVSLGYPCQRLANLPADARTTPCAHACARRYQGPAGPYPRCLSDLELAPVLAAVGDELAALQRAGGGAAAAS